MGGQKAIYSLFGPLVGPLWVIFEAFLVWQMGKTGQPDCPECWYDLVPTCLFSHFCHMCAYFGLFLATFRVKWTNFAPFSHEKKTQNGFAKCSGCVPTLFHSVQLKIGQTGQPESPPYCFNLVPTCSTKSNGIKTYLAYFVIFRPTFASSWPLSESKS